MFRVCAIAFLTLAAAAHAADRSPLEQTRIEYLLAAIGAQPGAQFIRNGKAYDAQAAIDHLRVKLRHAGARVRTAEDFIRYCGSESSRSGEPYQIRFDDGHVVPSAVFFRQKLAEFDRQNGRGGPGTTELPRSADDHLAHLHHRSDVRVARYVRHDLLRVRAEAGEEGVRRLAEDMAHRDIRGR
jgi:hypothetical protein